ncbi:MAG: hypothetical protein IJW37_01570 [Lachnospiraceae bacterium]|nr:hypothetical protein [Lachnospiraceae bacterium]
MKYVKKMLWMLLLCVLVVGCGKEAKKEDAEKQQEESVQPNEKEIVYEVPRGEAFDSDVPYDKTIQVGTIEEQVLYDDNDVIIKATELSVSEYGEVVLGINIQNNREKSVRVQTRENALNQCLMPSILSVDVESGATSDAEIVFSKAWIQRWELTDITELKFVIYLADSDSLEGGDRWWIETEPIAVKTSLAASYTQQYDDSGIVLYDKDGIRIIAKNVNTDKYESENLVIYVENDTDCYVSVFTQNITISGKAATGIYMAEMLPQTKALDVVAFMRGTMDALGVEKIEEMEIGFQVFAVDMNGESLPGVEAGPYKIKVVE